jgi:hypothetical protein
MRVQRAPRSREQPSTPDATLIAVRRRGAPAATATRVPAPFVGEAEIDVTALRRRVLDGPGVLACLTVSLVGACRRQGLIDDEAVVDVLIPGRERWTGTRLEGASGLSPHGVALALAARSVVVPAEDACLTVVGMDSAHVRAVSGWPRGRLGSISVGAETPSVVPVAGALGDALTLGVRWRVPVTFTASVSPEDARRLVYALEDAGRAVRDGAGV